MYAAEATWIEKARTARECHFGQFDTMDADSVNLNSGTGEDVRPLLGRSFSSSRHVDLPSILVLKRWGHQVKQEYSKNVTFPYVFKGRPNVICWLNRLDLPSGSRFRIRASCSDISERKAKVKLSTWGSDAADLDGAAMCWIAFPPGKKHVESGLFGAGQWEMDEFNNEDNGEDNDNIEKWTNVDGESVRGARGRVKFRKDGFSQMPTILVALNMLDMDGEADLKIRIIVEDVSLGGFNWRIETWANSKLYSAGASWVALGFP